MAASGARRGAVAILVVIAAVVALAVGGRQLWDKARTAIRSDGCDFGSYNLTLSRAQNASQMTSVVIKRALPERAAVLVLGAALQESKLDNIASGDGDRDSVGVLQQRPSQGWGSATNLANVSYATGKFLDALVKVPNWTTASLASVVQEVQVSADGTAYAKHEAEAQALADVLMGKTAAGVTCNFSQPAKIASVGTVSNRIVLDLPVNRPSVSGTSVSVSGASWATAAWFVTHASSYGIDKVAYAGRVWTRAKGWQNDPAVSASAVNATLAA
ncbi:cobalt transporter [soil metagenome]